MANKEQQAINDRIRHQQRETTGRLTTRYGRTSKQPGQINIVLVEQNKQGGKCSVWNKTDSNNEIY